jgi:hypothetical protein
MMKIELLFKKQSMSGYLISSKDTKYTCRETIQAWLQGMPDLTLVINTQNAYYRRLVYQIVKKRQVTNSI